MKTDPNKYPPGWDAEGVKQILELYDPKREDILREGLSVLRAKLGASGMARFLRELGVNRGNYTEERRNTKDDRTVSDLMKEMDQTLPPQPQK